MAAPIKVTLYCPSMDKTITNVFVSTYRGYDYCVEHISALLGNPQQVWIYNLDHEPIEDFRTVTNNQHLLVATDYFERPLSETNKDVLVVQEGPARRAWATLTRTQKRDHVASLLASSPQKTYLTVPGNQVLTTISTILNVQGAPPPTFPTIASCLDAMRDNWDMGVDAFLGLQGMMKPYGAVESWDKRLLPVIALLSDATAGQGSRMSALVVETVRERGAGSGSLVVEVRDVLKVGMRLFEEAEERMSPGM